MNVIFRANRYGLELNWRPMMSWGGCTCLGTSKHVLTDLLAYCNQNVMWHELQQLCMPPRNWIWKHFRRYHKISNRKSLLLRKCPFRRFWVIDMATVCFCTVNVSNVWNPNTKKGSNERLFILTRAHSLHIFGEIPFIKPQNNTNNR